MEPAQSSALQESPGFTAKYVPEGLKMSWGLKNILIFAGLAVLAIVIWVYVSSPMVVTVTGSGEASVPATNATISFTLSSTNATISGAVAAVQASADSMRNYLKSKGIAESDIAQSQVTAVPAGLVTPGATGFQASISMAAKTTHVSDVGSLVSDLYTNGALVVAQPILSVENQNQLQLQAFNAALADAKSQAGQIGLLNWKFIRKIVSITQVSSPTTSTSTTKADTLTSAASSVAATNGVFKIVSAVSVSFKMW